MNRMIQALSGVLSILVIFCMFTARVEANEEPTEACCFVDGGCTDEIAAICTGSGGVPQGEGTDCTTANCGFACCLWDLNAEQPGCYDVPDSQGSICFAGFPQGPGTDCATTSCLSACCGGRVRENFACENLTLDDCVLAPIEGNPQPPGTLCGPGVCPVHLDHTCSLRV
jgi:hypothetical protein